MLFIFLRPSFDSVSYNVMYAREYVRLLFIRNTTRVFTLMEAARKCFELIPNLNLK